MFRSLFLLLCSLAILSSLQGQNKLPIGSWRSHLPYQSGEHLTQSKSELYYSTPFSIMVLDKEELSTRFITSVEGLSNTSIQTIRYVEGSEVLIIVNIL